MVPEDETAVEAKTFVWPAAAGKRMTRQNRLAKKTVQYFALLC